MEFIMFVKKKQVIVVGGGMAGLVTATSLIKKGMDVCLLEKNEECGGLVNTFYRDGFLFDGGIRAIENAGMILPMLNELEIDLELLPSKISLGIEDNIIHVENEDSLQDYEQQLKTMYPDSQEDVDKIIKVIQDMKKHMNVLFGSDSPFFKDAKRNPGYFFTGFIPWLFRLFGTFIAIMKMQVPIEKFLDELISDRSLKDIISQHFFKKTPAFFAMSYFALYVDYYYPVGGTGQLPIKIKNAIMERGGEVIPNTDITQLNAALKTITDSNGQQYSYEKLIWAADLKQLYNIVNAESLEESDIQSIITQKEKVLDCKGAESVFTVFMAVNQDPAIFRKISHGHFFYTPSKQGLADTQRDELSQLLANWDDVSKQDVLDWADRFCRLNTFELSIPVFHDEKAAPKGKTGLIASCLMDYELMKRIAQDGWEKEFSQYLEDRIIEVLDQSIYPGLIKNMKFKFSAGPLSIEKRVRSSEGAIVGWSFEKPVPINASMLNMKNSVKTVIPHVYKAGQWAASPAGLPTCILTARLAADQVSKAIKK